MFVEVTWLVVEVIVVGFIVAGVGGLVASSVVVV